jgi:hypothetical protein
MMLSAIVLLVGFIALAGMVARVNQVAQQTTAEGRQAILDEAGPLQDAIDTSLGSLAKRTATATIGPSPFTALTVTSPTQFFSNADVGLEVSGGTIPAGAKIATVISPTSATFSPAATAAGSVTITLKRTGFALDTTTTPTMEAAAINALQHLKRLEAGRGLFMDWRIDCGAGGAVTNSQVVAHLSDGNVWVEVRSSVLFTRSTACAAPLVAPLYPIQS